MSPFRSNRSAVSPHRWIHATRSRRTVLTSARRSWAATVMETGRSFASSASRTAVSTTRRSAAAMRTRFVSLAGSPGSPSGGSVRKSNGASSAGKGRCRSSSNLTISRISPTTGGRSIGLTATTVRARPSATLRGASPRASSSARSASAGFSASMTNVSTRVCWMAAPLSRSPRRTTASLSGPNLSVALPKFILAKLIPLNYAT